MVQFLQLPPPPPPPGQPTGRPCGPGVGNFASSLVLGVGGDSLGAQGAAYYYTYLTHP